jgi:hypothetical protein
MWICNREVMNSVMPYDHILKFGRHANYLHPLGSNCLVVETSSEFEMEEGFNVR